MGSQIYETGRVALARLAHGADLLEELTAVVRQHGFAAAEFRAIGALQRARLAFYDQHARTYGEFALDEELEIAALVGTVTRRDGEPAVHAHATLSASDGRAFGGHVAAGCIIFACEVTMQELLGDVPERSYDETTGLQLWRNV
jgi:uncharacterized protein